MGKMKAIYMEMLDEQYQGSHDAFIQDLSRRTCEEFIPVSYTHLTLPTILLV